MGSLNERVWESLLYASRVELLANHLVHLVTTRLYHRGDDELADCPLLGEVTIDSEGFTELQLATRTYMALERSGHLDHPERLSQLSAAELFAIPGLGPRSFLDLSCTLESVTSPVSPSTPDHHKDWKGEESDSLVCLKDSVSRLEAAFPLDKICSHDPRFVHLKLSGPSLAAGISKILAYSSVHQELERKAQLVEELGSALRASSTMPLDVALMELLAGFCPPKHQEALAARLGWDGRGGTTLEKAAGLSKVTRERIRQIESSVLENLRKTTFLPPLDRALVALEQVAATFPEDSSAILLAEKLATKRFHPAGVLSAASIFGRESSFAVEPGGSAIHLVGTDFRGFRRVLRSLSDVNYVASVSEFHERLRSLESCGEVSMAATRKWLTGSGLVTWLGGEQKWFWVPQKEGRNRYLNITEKILSVNGSATVESVRESLQRTARYRGQSASVPRHILASLLEVAGFILEDGTVVAREALDPHEKLGKVEETMYRILKEAGGPISALDFRRSCLKAGMNHHTFQVYRGYSPIIERPAWGFYALRGSTWDPAKLADMLVEANQESRETAVKESGWTKDGAVWLGYEVTEAILHSGVVFVPSAIRKIVGRRKFELLTVDCREVGVFAVGDSGNAWGFRPFLGRRGVEVGDLVVITVDTVLDCAMIQSGAMELLEDYAEGNGWGPERFLDAATRPDIED